MAVTHAHRNGWDRAEDSPYGATKRGHPGLPGNTSQTVGAPSFLFSTTADTVAGGRGGPISRALSESSGGERC